MVSCGAGRRDGPPWDICRDTQGAPNEKCEAKKLQFNWLLRSSTHGVRNRLTVQNSTTDKQARWMPGSGGFGASIVTAQAARWSDMVKLGKTYIG